ncbi:MAG: twin-arginine translocase TatA/TatE family subunit [Candidatus Woesebacteria bacterium]|nr:twin-arginine translocase TatA/TatE family subunit [Candidatus Woesebacteria bacterium]
MPLTNIGPTEIIIVAVVILILFGGSKLPQMGKGLGESLKEFRNALTSKKAK